MKTNEKILILAGKQKGTIEQLKFIIEPDDNQDGELTIDQDFSIGEYVVSGDLYWENEKLDNILKEENKNWTINNLILYIDDVYQKEEYFWIRSLHPAADIEIETRVPKSVFFDMIKVDSDGVIEASNIKQGNSFYYWTDESTWKVSD